MKRGIIMLLSTACFYAADVEAKEKRFSERPPGEISIDGAATDWAGALSGVKGSPVSLGVRNDDTFLYICLSMDRPMGVMMSGMTVWFDPDGGGDRTLGVRFPLGLRNVDHPPLPEPDRNREKMREMFVESLREMEILGPDKDDRREIRHGDVPGLEAAVDVADDVLVYELRIPLHTDAANLFAIDIKKNRVGMRVESPRPERMFGGRGGPGGGPGFQPGTGDGSGPGHAGFQEGAAPDGRRGGFGRGPGGRPEPLNIEVEITLAP